ncbi:MAG: DEAD/DEAH box helicase, partial [Planctomycetes bacterium]|nr:DEAD/DEAH box helicase [Planctomycetota bacterium]
MKFSELNLVEPLLKALELEKYAAPSPIQSEAIPHLLEGRDMFGCAQTGTGKTAAFALPILQRILLKKSGGKGRRPLRALVLAPTRELARQVADSFKSYARFTGLKTAVIYGGVSQHPQTASLRQGVDVLVATPGRLVDLMNQKLCSLREVEMLVLDEADHMLDLGFIHDVKTIVRQVPPSRQTLMFSATMPKEITALADGILRDPVKLSVTPASTPVEIIDQKVYFVDKSNKGRLLVDLLHDRTITSGLVFSRTKHGADKICKMLGVAGIRSNAIHGGKSQSARQEALSSFKKGKVRVLVATDIAARGIDVKDLSHVVNYDLP